MIEVASPLLALTARGAVDVRAFGLGHDVESEDGMMAGAING